MKLKWSEREMPKQTKLIKETTTGPGVCANCGGRFLEYNNREEDYDYGMYYEYTCEECNHSGNEYFSLVYKRTD